MSGDAAGVVVALNAGSSSLKFALRGAADPHDVADRARGTLSGGGDGGLGLRVHGEAATIRLWREAGVQVLPGAYLSREVDGVNPGAGFVRVALVGPAGETEDALTRIRDVLYERG